jgi:WD40 repeat protein
MLRKRYQLNWMFECPDAVLTCSVVKCNNNNFLVFGGHDKALYLMDEEMNIVDDRPFDGWCRCSYSIDIDGDGCDEILVGAGDGNFMVLKLNIQNKKLTGLMRYKSSKRINCCIAGDFTQDGNIELIFGSDDKSVKIFDSITAKEPKFMLYYDSWVTACMLGFLKLPDYDDIIYGLLTGTKNGLVQLIQFQNEMLDIIWQKDFAAQINDIKIGDVTNDGFNEILVSTDDSFIKILNSEGELIKEINTEEGRPISLLIEDIDGDNAKEIVAGCADGSLKIFHNPSLESQEFELKWKTKVSTSIKNVCYITGEDDQRKHIVFGGYDRSIRNITDFEWGQKEILNIPQKMKIPETKISKKDDLIKEIESIEDIPSDIRGHIFNMLKESGQLKYLMEQLLKLGYSEDTILDEFALLKTQKSVLYEKVTYPVWSLPTEEIQKEMPEEVKAEVLIEEQKKSKVQPLVIEESVKPEKDKLVKALGTEVKEKAPEEKVSISDSLGDIILDYLRQEKVVETKGQLINKIEEKGFESDEIEEEIDRLKDQGKVEYSRSKPKGWSLVK